jgi:hypothetical protein
MASDSELTAPQDSEQARGIDPSWALVGEVLLRACRWVDGENQRGGCAAVPTCENIACTADRTRMGNGHFALVPVENLRIEVDGHGRRLRL